MVLRNNATSFLTIEEGGGEGVGGSEFLYMEYRDS